MHKGHDDWCSLVVRSRDIGLTARVLALLENPCKDENFIAGVPDGCRRSYAEIKAQLADALAKRGWIWRALIGVAEGEEAMNDATGSSSGGEASCHIEGDFDEGAVDFHSGVCETEESGLSADEW